MGTHGSLVCPLWGSLLSYMPQRTGRHVYSPPLMNGRFRVSRKAFLQANTSKITNRIQRRGTRIENTSSMQPLILVKQAPC